MSNNLNLKQRFSDLKSILKILLEPESLLLICQNVLVWSFVVLVWYLVYLQITNLYRLGLL